MADYVRIPYPNDYWTVAPISVTSSRAAYKAIVDRPGGKHYTSSTTRERLWELATRTARGLRCYDGDKLLDLKRFIRQRRLNDTNPETNKRCLIQILEDADDTATFDRFLDLPPELRDMIYDFHFNSYNTDKRVRPTRRQFHAPPPITQVNSYLRQETFKAFYNGGAFELDFSTLKCEREATRHILKNCARLSDIRFVHIRVLGRGREGGYNKALVATGGAMGVDAKTRPMDTGMGRRLVEVFARGLGDLGAQGQSVKTVRMQAQINFRR